MAIIEVTLVPIGTKTTSLSPYIAEAEKVLKDFDVKYELNPMGTVIEADIDLGLKAVRAMQEQVFEKGAERVYTVLKIDDRRDKKASLEEKIKSVKEKM
ncbi:MAG: MTH1187 family thiamine-binding protein [Anaerococcus sp.]|nr:MTH1187 family thiamine-binding protein [Anaerococcus sp.]MDD7043816.1 MTH1187 family thiamine-binding protein [Peptoniphilaceae bacterium]MDY2919563.1 MTH1187 family thiamine-binding protein [Anaerococcus sp.]